jgi:cytochrome c
MEKHNRIHTRLAWLILLLVLAVSAGCGQSGETRQQFTVPGGDADRGQELLGQYGCHSCHSIPGVERADAMVGPPLDDWSQRSFVAGQFANEPDNLIRWIMNPQEMIPQTAMPDMGVTEQHARDMAAYLYTLGR